MKSESNPQEQPEAADAAARAQRAIQVAMDRRDNGGASAERDR